MDAYTRLCSLLLIVLAFGGTCSATVASSCSNENTGSGNSPVLNNYQSNGACTTTCSGYSFAIVQYDKCWCSNIAPGSTVSLSQCNQNCPGYPVEQCGNEGSGLFGYINLGKTPEGTAGASSSSAPTTFAAQSPSSTSAEDTVSTATLVLDTTAVSVQSSSPQASSTTPSTTSPTPQTATSSTPTWTPTPSASIMTVSGSVKTVVVTPSTPPQATTTVIAGGGMADDAAPASQDGGFFSNKGAVAGVFTVVGLIAAGLIGAAVWFFLRKNRQDQEGSERLRSFEEERGSRPPTFMSRRTSELGLKTDLGAGAGRPPSDEKTPTSTQMTPGTMSRRTSIPLTDSRLNAAAMFHDNGSHMSVASLQDNTDYSRPVLQVANPDRPGSSAIADD